MKILVIHSSNFDYKKELYEPIKKSTLSQNHTFILPFEQSSFPVMKSLIEKKEIDFILAEIAYPSTGQGIELGWAEVFGMPVVCVCKKGKVYSGAVKIVTSEIYEYGDETELLAHIQMIVEKRTAAL